MRMGEKEEGRVVELLSLGLGLGLGLRGVDIEFTGD